MTSRPTVLIIEDEPGIMHALSRLFVRAWGWNAREATSVSSGLAALALPQPPPDLIVLDMMFADGDGVEVLEFLRDTKSTVPVLVTTASDTLLKVAAAFSPFALLPKPVDLDTMASLAATVRAKSL